MSSSLPYWIVRRQVPPGQNKAPAAAETARPGERLGRSDAWFLFGIGVQRTISGPCSSKEEDRV